MKLIKTFFTILISFIGCTTSISARKEKTTISRLKLRQECRDSLPKALTPVNSVPEDTLQSSAKHLDALVTLAGYDKPVSASRETIHVTNLMKDSTISTVNFLIVYLDYQNRELHRRHVEINTDLPAGQTQLLSFPTWDIQHSFYYLKSVKPRRTAAPYDISINLISICAYPETTLND